MTVDTSHRTRTNHPWERNPMNTRTKLIAAATLIGTGLIAGCSASGTAATPAPAATVTTTATATVPGPTKTVTAQPDYTSFTVGSEAKAVHKGDLDGSVWVVTPSSGATCAWAYGVAGVGGAEGMDATDVKAAVLLSFPDSTDAVAFAADGGTCEWEQVA